VYGNEIATAALVPEEDHVAAMKSAHGVGRLSQDRGPGAVDARGGDAPGRKLLHVCAAAFGGEVTFRVVTRRLGSTLAGQGPKG
jgi:hypothetical protein